MKTAVVFGWIALMLSMVIYPIALLTWLEHNITSQIFVIGMVFVLQQALANAIYFLERQ